MSIRLSFFDEDNRKIEIKNQKKPIEFVIPLFEEVNKIPYDYINVTDTKNRANKVLSFKLNIVSFNSSVHIRISPNESKTAYFAFIKFQEMPDPNLILFEFDLMQIFCPSGKYLIKALNITELNDDNLMINDIFY